MEMICASCFSSLIRLPGNTSITRRSSSHKTLLPQGRQSQVYPLTSSQHWMPYWVIFVDLWRSVADGHDHFLFGSIPTANAEITRRGIDQLAADVQALFHLFN
ncbi:hypothetical protein MLD38_025319 [Melastoma candidum]|uniref:Uncharacterized protein n=1 Tax=Melastoma candidum TaxID=119954 RepID=A0ACB9NWL4_9MYRT|nr:hypothetical protein MLD38_025319 [Melastoma candidum]